MRSKNLVLVRNIETYKTYVCKECGKKFTRKVHKYASKEWKYCSALCKSRFYVKNNREKTREYNRRSYKKNKNGNIKLCVVCGRIIDDKGLKFCSDICKKLHTQEKKKMYRKGRQDRFDKYKESKGCYICGYNKYGGALDFHHNYDKKFRITLNRFCKMDDEMKEEMKKCSIICKNCHAELEHNNRWKVEEE